MAARKQQQRKSDLLDICDWGGCGRLFFIIRSPVRTTGSRTTLMSAVTKVYEQVVLSRTAA